MSLGQEDAKMLLIRVEMTGESKSLLPAEAQLAALTFL